MLTAPVGAMVALRPRSVSRVFTGNCRHLHAQVSAMDPPGSGSFARVFRTEIDR